MPTVRNYTNFDKAKFIDKVCLFAKIISEKRAPLKKCIRSNHSKFVTKDFSKGTRFSTLITKGFFEIK